MMDRRVRHRSGGRLGGPDGAAEPESTVRVRCEPMTAVSFFSLTVSPAVAGATAR